MEVRYTSKDLRLLKPKQIADLFLTNYFDYINFNQCKKEVKILTNNIPKLGLERVIIIKNVLERRLQVNIEEQRYNVCSKIKSALDFYLNNILDKTPLPKELYEVLNN